MVQVATAAAAIATVAVATSPAAAQRAYSGPAVLTAPAGTRALSMGNAFAVGSTDTDAVFYNAAFAERLRGASVGLQHFEGGASLVSASAGTEWWNGGLAFGVRALSYGSAGIEDALPAGEGDLVAAGSLSAERAATLTYGRRIRGVRVAASAHLVQQRTASESVSMFAGDVAAGTVIGPVSVALGVRNIGGAYELAGGEVELPTRVMLSAGAPSRAVGPLDVMPAASVTYTVAGDVIAGGGVELAYWPVQGRTFMVRAGARHGEPGTGLWTAGAGFAGDRLILDYALVPYDGGAVAHRFGVRWQ